VRLVGLWVRLQGDIEHPDYWPGGASSKVVERLGFVAGQLLTDANGEEVVRWRWSQPGDS